MAISGLGTCGNFGFYNDSKGRQRKLDVLDNGMTFEGIFRVESSENDEISTVKSGSENLSAGREFSESPVRRQIFTTNEKKTETLMPLGIGFANAGAMGYGMAASLISFVDSGDVIVRVRVATGEDIDVDMAHFDPRNATVVEMFAFCEYKDYIGEGVKDTWGSWSCIKKIISPETDMDFGTYENIVSKKLDWIEKLSEAKTVLTNESTGEKLSVADILALFEEKSKLTAGDLKVPKDWRTMSEEDWDKILEGIDKYIEDFRERIRELEEKQQKAALKAAAEAPSDQRALAASAAALKVAANGFFSGTSYDSDELKNAEETVMIGDEEAPAIDYEKNWTRRLKTDDQAVLRTAKAAQEMESKAKERLNEIGNTGILEESDYDGTYPIYKRRKRELI